MGIRLDWEIDSESTQHRVFEDPAAKRARRRARLRFIILLLILILALIGVAAAIRWRLEQTDAYIESLLRDTIEAEVAALRIGDLNAFTNLQRSADETWLQGQRAYFNTYQQIKLSNDLELNGTVRNLVLDGQRARVIVEEVIDGTPYSQVWFYWRYEDGWRHVPPDYTLWGVLKEYQGLAVTISYREVDETLARDMGVELESWINSTCGPILQCGDLPHIRVNIGTDALLTEPVWDSTNPWQLDLSSPYLVRARTDRPFSGQFRLDVAAVLAERLVDESLNFSEAAVYPRDSFYLRAAVVSWLTGRFVGIDSQAHLITSLAQNYGQSAVGDLIAALAPDASADVLRSVTGAAALNETTLDWRDFLTWRMRLENELRERGDLFNFSSLYTPQMQERVQQRFDMPDVLRPTVTLVEAGTAIDGLPQLSATVRYGPAESGVTDRVLFRLVDGTWKRAN